MFQIKVLLYTNQYLEAATFCKEMSRLTLAEIIDNIVVTERIYTVQGETVKQYTIRLNFYSRQEYYEEHNITPHQIESVIEGQFVKKLEHIVTEKLKIKKSNIDLDEETVVVEGRKSKKQKEETFESIEAGNLV